jgi:rare lipoprotein A
MRNSAGIASAVVAPDRRGATCTSTFHAGNSANQREAVESCQSFLPGEWSGGHLTASGEPYNPDALTAASRTLPIGSSVMVSNPATGRSVKVRINDRGPYVRGRSLDLSKRAAEEIGMTRKGVARVKVKRTDSKPERSESPNSAADLSSTSTPKS